MTVRIIADFPTGAQFRRDTAAMSREMRLAVQIGQRAVAKGLRDDLRREISGALGRGSEFRRARTRGGERLEKVVGMTRPPEREVVTDGEPFAQVFARGESADLLLSAHATGGRFTPTRGRAFAIPLHNFRQANRLLTPEQVAARFGKEKLAFIPSKDGKTIGTLALVDVVISSRSRQIRAATARRLTRGDERKVVPMFVLVRSVTLRKVLHPERIAEAWAEALPENIDRALLGMRGGVT